MNPYIAGFVASDGHIGKYCWLISQSHRSVDVLRKILKLFPEGRLKVLNSNNRYSQELSYNLIYKKNKDTNPFEDWNIPEGNKTYTLKFPVNKTDQENFLYLRAFFEGDGCVSLFGKKYPKIQIISNKIWCIGCMDFLKNNNIRSFVYDDKRHAGLSNLVIGDINSVYSFFDKIYEDNIPLFMDRKYYRWLEIQDICPKLEYERKVKHNLNIKEKKDIINLLKEGKRPFEVSKILGIAYGPIELIYRREFGGRKRLIEKKSKNIKVLLKQNLLCKDIENMGYSRKLINKTLKEVKNEIKTRRGIPISFNQKEKIKKMLIEGSSLKDICLNTGVAFSTVYKYDRLITGGRDSRISKKIKEVDGLLRQGYSIYRVRKEFKFSSVVLKKAKELFKA